MENEHGPEPVNVATNTQIVDDLDHVELEAARSPFYQDPLWRAFLIFTFLIGSLTLLALFPSTFWRF